MDQNNPLFAYLMAHPLSANTGSVSSPAEGATRVGQGAMGGMNNMLMAQLMAQQKKVAPKYNSIDDLMGAKGLFGMGDMSFPEFAPGP